MGSRKRFILPVLVVALLVFLLGAIGWLAFLFFARLAERTAPVEPFFAVTTAGVQRVTHRSPSRLDAIVLDEHPDAAVPVPTPVLAPPPVATDPQALSPAVCGGYEEAITSRPAWVNPLEHASIITPTRVTVNITTPRPPRETTQ